MYPSVERDIRIQVAHLHADINDQTTCNTNDKQDAYGKLLRHVLAPYVK